VLSWIIFPKTNSIHEGTLSQAKGQAKD